ncbi:carbohydrate ABC transporter permease [Anaerocolumna sp. MB42-C2]|uniref:carbohydrate ABC transporter permease n=1 Tax=Anaerocolumna sp. MB42-C2 TaxID=3070997 RepID=UPI0027DF7A5A|nr:carbohydrate ABC transporter permease [Anaerocolumna sp. MB42-C2]WMJ85362.1 carbohydrate ABC transporter permease [Anaerocolumna sp. MB42-C2]
MYKKNKKKEDLSGRIIRVIGYIFIGILALACLLPFLIMVSASFENEKTLVLEGYSLIPRNFTTFAYDVILKGSNEIVGSYIVTILLTVVGTSLGLFVTAMTGYALQRPDFQRRNMISLFLFFTTLFSGGLVPFYLLMTRYLMLKNNYLAVLLPSLISAWNIIMIKNFIKNSIPHSVSEAANIDGASPFVTFMKVILPMSKPALATIGLFIGLGYWNEWYNAMLFLDNSVKFRPLQLLLYNLINQAEYLKNSMAGQNIQMQDLPLETVKMATAVLATGPVILAYPMVQKYFIQGITVGAVKG